MRATPILLGMVAGVFAGEILPMNLGLELEMRSEFSNILPRADSTNFQTFTGSQGGKADPISATGDSTRPFRCSSETFTSLSDAVQRSCSNQQQACSQAANNPGGGGGGGGNGAANGALTVKDCEAQGKACTAATEGLASSKLVNGDADTLVFC